MRLVCERCGHRECIRVWTVRMGNVVRGTFDLCTICTREVEAATFRVLSDSKVTRNLIVMTPCLLEMCNELRGALAASTGGSHKVAPFVEYVDRVLARADEVIARAESPS